MPPPTPNPKSPTPKATDETIKETFESIVIAFILAFIFRAYVVEAFIIPTGSMAPTLLGEHVALRCEQCGYDFATDQSGAEGRRTPNRVLAAACPMCKYPQPVPMGQPTQTGDRLLVQKYLYALAEPSRWDVVVFRNPQRYNENGTPGPQTNYIKRLVGLPNEALHLIDGNVYVRPFDQPNAPWRIARKTDPAANRHWEKIQRSVWQPIYHSQYVPLDHGRADRTAEGDAIARGDPGRRFDWDCPWVPPSEQVRLWDRGNADDGWKRSYRYTPPVNTIRGQDVIDLAAPGVLEFNWAEYHGRGTFYAYNALSGGQGIFGRQPIEDMRLAATVEPQAPDVMFTLETTTRIENENEIEHLYANFYSSGTVQVFRSTGRGKDGAMGSATFAPITPGQTRSIELWVVDQEILVWVDGEVVFRRVPSCVRFII